MAVTIIDHRQIRDEADSVTGWVNATLGTSEPTPIESTGRHGIQVSTTTDDIYHEPGGTTNLSNKLIYIWSQNRAALDTLVNGGIGIFLTDGTNDISFHIAGSDAAGFRYETGPVTWQSHLMDTSRPPTNTTARVGSLAAFNSASVTGVGLTFKTLAKSVGGAVNCFIDIIRIGDPVLNNGAMVSLTTGTSGDPITFLEWATNDRGIGNRQAYGIIRRLGVGSYALQGSFRIGDPTGSVNTWFEDTNTNFQFEDRNLLEGRYGITVVQGTGTTTVNWGSKSGTGNTATGTDGLIVTIPVGVGGKWDSGTSGSDASVNIYGTSFSGFSEDFILGNGQEFIDDSFIGCGTIYPSSSLLYNSSVVNSVATSSLVWNTNIDPNGYLDNMTFVGSGSTNYAIEFGPNVPDSMSLNNIQFNNYGATGTTSAALYNNAGKPLYITVLGDQTVPTTSSADINQITLITNVRTLTLESIVSGSEISLIRIDNNTEIASLESVDTDGLFTYSYSYTTDIDVVAYVHNITYEWQAIPLTLRNSDQTVTVQQRFDRNYTNPD